MAGWAHEKEIILARQILPMIEEIFVIIILIRLAFSSTFNWYDFDFTHHFFEQGRLVVRFYVRICWCYWFLIFCLYKRHLRFWGSFIGITLDTWWLIQRKRRENISRSLNLVYKWVLVHHFIYLINVRWQRHLFKRLKRRDWYPRRSILLLLQIKLFGLI